MMLPWGTPGCDMSLLAKPPKKALLVQESLRTISSGGRGAAGRAAHLLLPTPRSEDCTWGAVEGPRSQASLCWQAGEPRFPAVTHWAGVVLVGKGLRAPQLAAGEQAGGLTAARRDPDRRLGERGGRGFPVALQRTAVTSRGLLGAVRAGEEAQEPRKPASVRIPPAPSQTLDTLRQHPSQKLRMRWWVAAPLGATARPAWLRARYGQEHPAAAGYRGLPKLGEMPDDPGLHHPTSSHAQRYLPVLGSPASTDTGEHDPAAHRHIQEGERGEYNSDQLFSLLDKHREEKKTQQLPPVCFAETLNPC